MDATKTPGESHVLEFDVHRLRVPELYGRTSRSDRIILASVCASTGGGGSCCKLFCCFCWMVVEEEVEEEEEEEEELMMLTLPATSIYMRACV